MGSRDEHLDTLDDLLARVRQRLRSPAYRSHLLTSLKVPGVGVGTLRALRSVGRIGTPSIKDIATDLGVEQSTASRAVTEAETCGWVERATSTQDQRQVIVTLTQSGEHTLQRMTSVRRNLLDNATSSWSDDEILLLSELLESLLSNLEIPE